LLAHLRVDWAFRQFLQCDLHDCVSINLEL
jgi:hypothetical protein